VPAQQLCPWHMRKSASMMLLFPICLLNVLNGNNLNVDSSCSAARMAESVLLALNGQRDVVECTFVESSLVPGFPFFSSRVRLGPNGVEEFLPLGTLSDFEQEGMEAMKDLLTKNINAGVSFVNGP